MPAKGLAGKFAHLQLDNFIRAVLIAVLGYLCFRVLQPFLVLLAWSIILAISLYPLHRRLAHVLRLRPGVAALLITLASALVLLVPTYLLGVSVASSMERAFVALRSNDFRIPEPSRALAEWPLVGQALHDVWRRASSDTADVIKEIMPYVRREGLGLLGKIASIGIGFALFVVALIIAGFVMAYGERGSCNAVRVASRLTGAERGPRIAALCTSTVRAVAQGVIGIAFLQMLVVGVGLIVADIPAAGLLALVVLLASILQLPTLLVTLPIIIGVFIARGATTGTIVFAVYILIASHVDNLLKPLVLGRGSGAPMPVVLIGVLGGTMTSGLIGLFIGPVLLAVGYQLFWQWVDDAPTDNGDG